MTSDQIDEKRLREALAILKPNGELFEVRMLGKRKAQTYSGYFVDADTAVEQIKKIDDAVTVYFTLHDIKPECYAREQCNRMIKNPSNTTSDSDIIGYSWLFVDLDPKRSAGVSSSKEELEASKQLAMDIIPFMTSLGFEEPIVSMSGNGYHLLYSIALANNEANTKLIKDCLTVLDQTFSNDKVEVDTANFNPSRICKLYGTLAQKGTGTNDRPHRMSCIVQTPQVIKATDKVYLEKLAAMLPQEQAPAPYNGYNPKAFDIEEWLNRYSIGFKQKLNHDYTKYILDVCPFDSNHKAPDSMITVGNNGAIGFKCLHNSCQGKTWHDVRVLFEPDAYDKAERSQADDSRINEGWKEHKAKYAREIEIEYPDIEPEDDLFALEPETKVEHEGFLTAKQINAIPDEIEDYIPTGIKMLDDRLHGLKRGMVTLVSGLRGGSKSTFLSNVALNALDAGYSVMAYSGELTNKNFMKWMYLQACGKTFVKPSKKFNHYWFVPDEYKRRIAEWMGDRFMLYNNDYGNKYEELKKRMLAVIKEQKTDLVILDNLMILDIDGLDERQNEAQKKFITELTMIAKATKVHILWVAHPRKAQGFLRLDDVLGSTSLASLTDNAIIIHRNNNDFKRLSAEMFHWTQDNPVYTGTNVVEIAKDRDNGTQDVFIPLWYEPESKRLKNTASENINFGWVRDEDMIPDEWRNDET